MQLQIPRRFEESLVDFLSMSRKFRKVFIDAIVAAPIMLSHRKLANHIAPKIELDKNKIAGIVAMLASLYRTMEDTPIDEFVVDFYHAAISFDKTSTLDIEWDDIKKDLKTVLSNDSFGVTSKAMDILSHYPNTYCSARLVTDIRPVFGQNTNECPPASLVVHTLRISSHQDDSDTKDYYVSLDSQDLHELRRIIERALEKETTLKSMINDTKMQYIDLEEN